MPEVELVGLPDEVRVEFDGAPLERPDDWFEYAFDDELDDELVGLPDVVRDEFDGAPTERLCDFVPFEAVVGALYEPPSRVATVERGP